jgi:hypothetical protein
MALSFLNCTNVAVPNTLPIHSPMVSILQKGDNAAVYYGKSGGSGFAECCIMRSLLFCVALGPVFAGRNYLPGMRDDKHLVLSESLPLRA